MRLCRLQEPRHSTTKLFTKCNWHSEVLLLHTFSHTIRSLENGNAHIARKCEVGQKSVQGCERLSGSRLRVCQLPIELAASQLTATAITVMPCVRVSHPCFSQASMMTPGGQGFKLVALRKPDSPPRPPYGTTHNFSSSAGQPISWRIIKRFELSPLLFYNRDPAFALNPLHSNRSFQI
jgi:hypothetical protein